VPTADRQDFGKIVAPHFGKALVYDFRKKKEIFFSFGQNLIPLISYDGTFLS
jgi:hypothetical protein